MPERKTKDSLEYKEYVRRIKKLGGKQIATPDEFDKISVGLSKRYIAKKGWLPKLRANVKRELASQKKAKEKPKKKFFQTPRTIEILKQVGPGIKTDRERLMEKKR